jgi:hypothetical protein
MPGPMRFSFQACAASVFALGAIGLFLGKNPDSFALSGNVTALTLAVVIGLASSAKLHRTPRRSFMTRLLQRETIQELEGALAEVRQLQGILPICSSGKKIRQEHGDWTGLEKYISARSEARFSHGLCPDCRVKLYPEFSPRLQES